MPILYSGDTMESFEGRRINAIFSDFNIVLSIITSEWKLDEDSPALAWRFYNYLRLTSCASLWGSMLEIPLSDDCRRLVPGSEASSQIDAENQNSSARKSSCGANQASFSNVSNG